MSKKGLTIDSYIQNNLIEKEKMPVVIEAVKGIRHLVKRFKFTTTAELMATIDSKLEHCRNQENNIDSEV